MLKKVLIGVLALLALGAAIIAYLLLPAHLQIRSIAPELPTQAELEALKGNPEGPVRISYFITSDQASEERDLGHSTFVIEWEDGKILLIDLGMDEAAAIKFGELLETVRGADPAIFRGTVPDFLGDDMERVQGVGFTHLHLDHVQGIVPVCAAIEHKIAAIHTADQFAQHNLHTEDQFALLQQSACAEQQALSDDARVLEQFPGIGIYPLGGHTPGSTMFAVPIGDQLWLLTGDITNARSDLIENRGKGFLYSYLMVPEDEGRLKTLRVLLAGFDKDPGITAITSHDAESIAASGMELWQKAGEGEGG